MIEELDDSNWRKIENDRISVVKVGASWCGPCRLLKPHYNRWSEDFSLYNYTEIRYYEVDGDRCLDFKKNYCIDRYPTTLFLIHGVVVFKLYGMTRLKVFEELLKKTLTVPYERRTE